MGGDPLQYPCGGLSDGQDGPARALRAGRCTARKGSSLEVLAGRQCPAYTQGQVALRGAGLGHRDRDLPGTGFPMVFKRVCTQNLHGPAPMRNVGPQPPGGHRLSASARAMRCGPLLSSCSSPGLPGSPAPSPARLASDKNVPYPRGYSHRVSGVLRDRRPPTRDQDHRPTGRRFPQDRASALDKYT